MNYNQSVLTALNQRQPLTFSQLKRLTGSSYSALKGCLAFLITKGYVSYSLNDYHLTIKGEQEVNNHERPKF